jgi:hypothetical protein
MTLPGVGDLEANVLLSEEKRPWTNLEKGVFVAWGNSG